MNMKTIVMCCLALISSLLVIHATCQEMIPAVNLPVDPDSQKIMYRDVVQEPGDPGYLYNKAIEWFNYYYANPTSILKIQDKVNGKIEGTGRMDIFYSDDKGNKLNAGVIQYTIRLEFKDDRYRYTITDLNLKSASRFPVEKWLNRDDPAYNTQWDSYLYQVDTVMQRLTSTLVEKMKPVEEKKDEW